MAIRQYELYEKTSKGEEKIFTFRFNSANCDSKKSKQQLEAVVKSSFDIIKSYKANNYYIKDIRTNKKIYLRNYKK